MLASSESFRARASSAAFASVLVYVAGFLVLFVAILRRTEGHFTYALDDPYIHLALSERIRHGFYGLNTGEAASPSSSVLWPFLFAPFPGTTLMTYLPLCLNFVFGCCVALLLGKLVDRYVPEVGTSAQGRWMGRALAVLLLIGTNTFGLTFAGLEQLLELLLCVSCAFLCIAAAEQRPIPRWTLVAATVLPMVRYEGALVTLASVLVLWWVGSRRAAAAVLVLSMLPVALFSLFLHHLKLPPVPISVVIKGATVATTGGHIHGMLLIAKGALLGAFFEPERSAVFVLMLVCLSLLYLHFQRRALRPVLLAVSAVAVVQFFYGPFGWLFRYEMYCIGFVLPVVIASELGRWGKVEAGATNASPRVNLSHVPGLLLVAVGALAMVYAPALYATLNAAQSVWRQQGQMARFTHDFYKGPVAVNDLGLVAYRRDPKAYVLDVAGLGSPEVYRLMVNKTFQTHLADLTREHHVGLIVIYPQWFKQLPAEWHPIAKMCSADIEYGPAHPRVMFYSTPNADEPALLDDLARFRKTLGRGTTMELQPQNADEICRAAGQ